MPFKKLLIKGCIFILFIVASELIFITSSEAVTENFQWTGLKGYSVSGTYSYDEAINTGIIEEKGAGKTNQLDSLTVTFYNPEGKVIYQCFNVVAGKSRGNYFEFNLDTTTKKLIGNIDLGGEKFGELFLKGRVDNELSLIGIESSGREYVLDKN